MKLEDVLKNLDGFDNDSVIFAEKNPNWSADSKAIVIDEDESVSQELKYLIEVDAAKEVVEIWSKWRNGHKPTIKDICDAVIYYAENDAYLPTDC